MSGRLAHRGLLLKGSGLPDPGDFVAQILYDGPIAFHRLNEASGTNSANLAGGSDGTYSSSFTTLHASGGPVAGGGYITVAQPSAPGQMPGMVLGNTTNYTAAFTLMCMVSLASSQPAMRPHIFTKNQYFAMGFDDFPVALYSDSARKLYFAISSGNDFSADVTVESSALTADTFYLVHATYQANSLVALYVNGVLVDDSTHTYTVSSNSTAWRVGSALEYSSGAQQGTMSGGLAEVALFPSALSSTRIAAHFSASGL